MVAMRTYYHPSPSKTSLYNSMDINFPLDIPDTPGSDAGPSNDWEFWGENSLIELCEVHLQFNFLGLSSCFFSFASNEHTGINIVLR